MITLRYKINGASFRRRYTHDEEPAARLAIGYLRNAGIAVRVSGLKKREPSPRRLAAYMVREFIRQYTDAPQYERASKRWDKRPAYERAREYLAERAEVFAGCGADRKARLYAAAAGLLV